MPRRPRSSEKQGRRGAATLPPQTKKNFEGATMGVLGERWVIPGACSRRISGNRGGENERQKARILRMQNPERRLF